MDKFLYSYLKASMLRNFHFCLNPLQKFFSVKLTFKILISHITPLELTKFSLSIFTAIFKALAKALKSPSAL